MLSLTRLILKFQVQTQAQERNKSIYIYINIPTYKVSQPLIYDFLLLIGDILYIENA